MMRKSVVPSTCVGIYYVIHYLFAAAVCLLVGFTFGTRNRLQPSAKLDCCSVVIVPLLVGLTVTRDLLVTGKWCKRRH